MYSLGLILHFMLVKDLPDYYDNLKTGNFKVPKHYSKEIYELLGKLLKKKPEERPMVREIMG